MPEALRVPSRRLRLACWFGVLALVAVVRWVGSAGGRALANARRHSCELSAPEQLVDGAAWAGYRLVVKAVVQLVG